jgi:kynurenine formamidase
MWRRTVPVTLRAAITFYVALALANASAAQSRVTLPQLLAEHDIVDLTHALDHNFPFIPVPGITFPFGLEPIATLERNGVAANQWRIHEHIGTQIDAPNHFARGGAGLDALSVGQLIVPAVIIDFRAEAAADRDAVLTIDHIRAWEMRHGPIPAGAAVALYTGWDRRIGDPTYIGLDEKNVMHFPGIGADTAAFLAEERNVWGVGVDTLSFDPGSDKTYATHRALLGRGRWALEALANLDQVPPTGATLVIGALKVRGATGGPVRVLALGPRMRLSHEALAGTWESTALEEIRAADGRSTFLKRAFSFSEQRWSITFTVYADTSGTTAVLRGRNDGRFTIGRAMPLAQAFEADFRFESRSLTPLTDDVAAALTTAHCGRGTWRAGEPQDVTERGCPAFRVRAASECPMEFDVVRLQGRELHLGTRPATGDLCRPEARPLQAATAALARAKP